jgi:hypothetical protein
MTTTLSFTIVFATIMFFVAVVNWLNYRRKISEVFDLKTILEQAEKEKKLLKEEITRITRVGGIGESSVMALIGEISRVENNLYHMQKMTDSGQMQEVPGRKQISKAIDRMKATLQAEDYTIVPLLGTDYHEGMQAIVAFVEDENVPLGSSVIISVQKPQVNRSGRMIQAPTVTVGQNE